MGDQSFTQPNLLSAVLSTLLSMAEAAARNAHAPYSRFFVGAALLLESGDMVAGANVENASYRLTTCAEQSAIAHAVCTFGPGIRIRAMLIQNLNAAPCQPCGACRQAIAEFAPPEALILFPAADGKLTQKTLAELLPGAFYLGHT